MSLEATYDENVSIKMSYENMTNAEQVAWRPDKPHNQLPPLPPPQELESRAVLKACITARAALAELKQAAELIPNQTMLINTIPLLEAKDSSEIENIVTTTDKLFQHAQTDGHGQADPATKEALRYRSALLEDYAAVLEVLPARTMITAHRKAEQAIKKILRRK